MSFDPFEQYPNHYYWTPIQVSLDAATSGRFPSNLFLVRTIGAFSVLEPIVSLALNRIHHELLL